MRAVVTGAAGFIGSQLSERLLAEGWSVIGVDCYTDYYPIADKRANVSGLVGNDRFDLVEADLLHVGLPDLLADADVVFHLAAQPGVRLSWTDRFRTYSSNNVDATQRLLDGVRAISSRPRLVFASSSSVYGDMAGVATPESVPLRPHSPYGVTKVAGELLVDAYTENFGVEAVSLRFFSVYGPRQRPDMALHRMIEAVLRSRPFPLLGDGSNIRDFTYVGDVVEACLRAGTMLTAPTRVMNVAGGALASVNELLSLVGNAVGRAVPVVRQPSEAGDVARTFGSIDRAGQVLGWKPVVSLEEGVALQIDWHRARRVGFE